MIICRKSTDGEPSKAVEQQPVNVQTTPSLTVVSASPPLAGACLMACSNVDARSSTQQILRYLESLKDAEADQEGTDPPSLLQAICSPTNSSIIVCVVVTARFEAAEKALVEERATWLVANQSLLRREPLGKWLISLFGLPKRKMLLCTGICSLPRLPSLLPVRSCLPSHYPWMNQ
jgi:hypothetical protein